MKGWLLDTNVVASLSAPTGAAGVKAWAAAQDERRLYLSILTLAEYDKGICNLSADDPKRHRYAFNRDAIETRFEGRILPVTNGAIRRWGVLSSSVKRDRGHPPPVIDTLLAASAIEAHLYLVTRNTKDVAGLGAAVFNPWQDDPAAFPLTA